MGFFHSLEATLERIAREPDVWSRALENEQRNLRELEGFIKQRFEREAELAQARQNLAALTAELEREGVATPGPAFAIGDDGEWTAGAGAISTQSAPHPLLCA